MEPITHLLTGACLGRAGFNRKTAYATLAMTLAAEAPDLDILWSLRGPVAGFEHHRGITHTLLGAPFVALVVTVAVWLFHRFRRKPPALAAHWLLLWCFALLAVLSHIALDYANNYGVRPFFPFNPHWYAGSILFIFDPILFVVLLFGLVIPSIFGLVDRELSKRRALFRGRGLALAALIGAGILCGLRATEHARALHLINQTSFGPGATERSAAEPYPIDPFHWEAIVETPVYYQFGDVDTRRDAVETDDTHRLYKAPVTPAVAAAKQSWLGRVYLGWSQFPLTEDTGPGLPPDSVGKDPLPLRQVEFHDMRFGYSGWLGQHGNRKPLSGTVYVSPNGQIEAAYMDGKLQP